MKILLILSYYGMESIPTFPLGLSYLAGALDNHQVEVLDPNIEENHLQKIEDALKRFAPDVVGISLRNIWSYNLGLYYSDAVLPILKLIKSCGNYPVVFGGSGFTAYAKEIMEAVPQIDYGVYGEGEETFPQLLNHLDHPEAVKCVFYRKDGKVCFSGAGILKNFDELPSPRRDIFKIDSYKNFPAAMGVQSKRGCILKCAYCIYPKISRYKLSSRSPKEVVDEIQYLVDTHHLKEIIFVDSVFNIPMKHAEEICRELIKRNLNIKWTGWFCLKNMTREFIQLAVKAGCRLFELSPDAYTDKSLMLLGKNIKTSDIVRTYKLFKQTPGANVHYNFFYNGPGENIFSFLRLLLFFLRAKIFLGTKLKHFVISHVHIEPHTELYRLSVSRGMVRDQAGFLGPAEDYDKNIYINSKFVESVFHSLVTVKRLFKCSIHLIAGRKKRDEKDKMLLYGRI